MGSRGRWTRLAWPAFLAVAAALPTLVWALTGGDLLVDDWWFSAVARFEGVGGFSFGSRPLEAAYNAALFGLFGARPLPHLLVLAALNGIAAVLVWQIARRLLSARLAVLTSLLWVVLPNRGSMRLWISNAPHMLSLCLLLCAALLTCRQYRRESRPHLMAVVALVVLAALAYEGSLALGVVVAGLAAWGSGQSTRDRWLQVGASLLPFAAVGGLMVRYNPNRAETVNSLFEHAGRLIPVHFGVGVLPPALLMAGMVLIGAVVWSVACLVAPSFTAREEERAIIGGVVVLVIGALPFLAVGFPFGTQGIFDRGNLFADLGTATLMAGALGLLWRLRVPVLAGAAAAAAVVVLAAGNLTDVRDWRVAAADGRRLLQAARAVPADQPAVVAPLPGSTGIQMFVEGGNLSHALAVRTGSFPGPPIEVALTVEECQAFAARGAAPYRFQRDELLPAPCS